MQARIVARLMAVALVFLCGAANADVLSFKFTGTVTYSTYLAPVGSMITGTFSYETSHNPRRKDLPPGYNHSYADYAFTSPFEMSATVNGHTIGTTGLTVQVFNNNAGFDMVDVNAYPPAVDGTTYADGGFGFRLMTDAGKTGALHNTRLPRSYDVGQFDSNRSYGYLQSDGGQTGRLLSFTIDAIDVVQSSH